MNRRQAILAALCALPGMQVRPEQIPPAPMPSNGFGNLTFSGQIETALWYSVNLKYMRGIKVQHDGEERIITAQEIWDALEAKR